MSALPGNLETDKQPPMTLPLQYFVVGFAFLPGGLLTALSLAGVAVIVARRLFETQVERTSMLSRYAVVASALLVWSVLAARAWLADPLARDSLLGAPGAMNLLVFGVIGFVVLGTLYHISRSSSGFTATATCWAASRCR